MGAAAALVHTVPNLIDQIVVTDELARRVLRGNGAMPGYEQSFDFHDARRVLKYQATLGQEAEVEEPEVEEPAPGVEPDQRLLADQPDGLDDLSPPLRHAVHTSRRRGARQQGKRSISMRNVMSLAVNIQHLHLQRSAQTKATSVGMLGTLSSETASGRCRATKLILNSE